MSTKKIVGLLMVLTFLNGACGDDSVLSSPTEFNGSDPGAGPSGAGPDSQRAAAAFDEAAGALGPVNLINFEDSPEGPFQSLEVAPGVIASLTGTTTEGGIINGCFSECATAVRRGYNVTPGGKQYLGVALIFNIGTAALDFSFQTPVQAFGTYIIGLGSANGDLFVEFNDGTARSMPVPGNPSGGAQFFGFTAPGASIAHVTLTLRSVTANSRDNFSVDDVRYTSST